MSENKYLKPMLDTGSPRVFNCNDLTHRILAKDPEAKLFFRNKKLNDLVLIKDTVPEAERRDAPNFVGTKLYFPFNEHNIYEGGRTIFYHDRHIKPTIEAHFGENALDAALLAEDMRIISILDRLPSLDPFLMKDVFIRQGIEVNPDYFEVSPEAWQEIEVFMLARFEPLVTAAFPEALSSDEKARLLMEKIWEARDLEALQPLINAFRLPQHEALDIFASWKGIVYYSFLYQKVKQQLGTFAVWLRDNEVPIAGISAAESKDMATMFKLVKDQMRSEWQVVEDTIKQYETAYNKMFRLKESSSEFLTFLKNSNKTYWTLGNSFGKTNHALYCWGALSARLTSGKIPWPQLLEIMRPLTKIYEPTKKTATSVSWS